MNTHAVSPAVPDSPEKNSQSTTMVLTRGRQPHAASSPKIPFLFRQSQQRHFREKWRLTTLQGIWVGFLSFGALATLFGTLSMTTLHRQHQAIQLLGEEVATEVLTAQRIEESLAAIDANQVNLLLLPANQQTEARQALERHQQKVASDLLRLAKTSPRQSKQTKKLGQKKRRLLAILQTEFGDYLRELERAQILHVKGDQKRALAIYQDSVHRLEGRLLSTATALRETQNTALEDVYSLQQKQIDKRLLRFNSLGFFLVVHLLLFQIFLSNRTHRTLNLGLMLTIFLVGGGVVQGFQSLKQSFQQLEEARNITFARLQNMRASRNSIYHAHSGINRALLGAKGFDQATREIADLRLHITYRKGSSGHSFAVKTLTEYVRLTQRVQALQAQNRDEAIALATGYRQGQLNAVFEALKVQQQSVIEIQQATFDQRLSQNQRAIAGLQWKIPVGLGLALGLTAAGLYPRWREYKI